MPLERCSKDGKSGWKVHNANTCFVGPGARQKALKQLQAIEISKHKRGKAEKNILEKTADALKEQTKESKNE